MSPIPSALYAPSGERDVKSPVEAWHGSDEGPCGEKLDESFVSSVGEDEEWEDSGEHTETHLGRQVSNQHVFITGLVILPKVQTNGLCQLSLE